MIALSLAGVIEREGENGMYDLAIEGFWLCDKFLVRAVSDDLY